MIGYISRERHTHTYPTYPQHTHTPPHTPLTNAYDVITYSKGYPIT